MRKILVGLWLAVAAINAGVAVMGLLTGADGILTLNQGTIALLSVLIAVLNHRLGQYEEKQ